MSNINVTGTFTDPHVALKALANQGGLDLILMDVNMPRLSGIELAKILRAKTKRLIFITAHTKYAFQAFETDADAYILKPYTFDKFYNTINRIFPIDAIRGLDNPVIDDHFLVKNTEEDLRIIKVKFDEVIAFESSHNYVKIYTSNDKVISAYLNNKHILDLVRHHKEFHQFHRSFIISTNHIDYIDGALIKMKNSLTFSVGEYYRDNFNAYVGGKLIKTARNNKGNFDSLKEGK